MPVVPLKEILDRAFAERYGVAAINVVNDLTMEAVLAAAVQERSPVIIQTSVKTVRSIGMDLLFAMWREMTAGIGVPVSLHLDHCPDRAVISACLRKGWNSVLFDASSLPVAENQRQTIEVVAEARSHGAHVEGEIEAITGVEDDIGSDEVTRAESLPTAVEFIKATGVDVFAPAISNAHGQYHGEPRLDAQRVSDIVAAQPIPIALHGGTGMTDAQFTDLIARLREGEHLDRSQGRLHAGQPGFPARCRGPRQLGPAVAVHGGAGRRAGDGRRAHAQVRQRRQGVVRPDARARARLRWGARRH